MKFNVFKRWNAADEGMHGSSNAASRLKERMDAAAL